MKKVIFAIYCIAASSDAMVDQRRESEPSSPMTMHRDSSVAAPTNGNNSGPGSPAITPKEKICVWKDSDSSEGKKALSELDARAYKSYERIQWDERSDKFLFQCVEILGERWDAVATMFNEHTGKKISAKQAKDRFRSFVPAWGPTQDVDLLILMLRFQESEDYLAYVPMVARILGVREPVIKNRILLLLRDRGWANIGDIKRTLNEKIRTTNHDDIQKTVPITRSPIRPPSLLR